MFLNLNAFLRLRARTVLKEHAQTAILVMFLASLPGLLLQVIAILTNSSVLPKLQELLMSIEQNPALINSEALLQPLLDIQLETYIPVIILALISAILSPMLMQGLLHYLIDLMQGQPHSAAAILERRRNWLKAIGLNIVKAIRVLLWMIPGMLLMTGMTAAIYGFANSSNVDMMLRLLPMVILISYAAMLVPMIMAMLRYGMAEYVLADVPETGIFACIRRSKEIMARKKGQLFGLFFFFYFLIFLIQTIDSFLSIFSPVLASTIGMFLSLIVNLYMFTTASGFYLQHTGRSLIPVANPGESPEDNSSNDLN